MTKRSLALAPFLLLAATPALAADAAHPTVIELYQSQGCSSCPPANAQLNAIAGRADLLALSFAVTYWDRLGWKDIFGHPAYTARQWDYAKAGGRGNVATPQFIVNGRGVVTGSNAAKVAAALKQYDRGTTGPTLAFAAGKVIIGAARSSAPATVWLVRYDPRTHNVPIRSGENGGRSLPHRNIVRGLWDIGGWTGKSASFAIPASKDPAMRSAILVQQGKGGPIVAALRI